MKAKHFTGTTIADLDDFFIVNPANNSLDLSNYSLNQEIILKCDSSTTLNIVNSTVTNPRTNLDTTSTVKMSTGDVLSIVNLSSGIVLFTLGYDSSVTLEGNNFNGTNQLTKTGADGKLPSTVIPVQTIRNVVVLNTIANMLAQTGLTVGDCTSVTNDPAFNDNGFYILVALPENNISNWSKIVAPDQVVSVNTKPGPNIVLDKTDIGLSNVQNVDQTNADNITSGTVSAARLPVASATTDGIVDQNAQEFEGEKTFKQPIIGNLRGHSDTTSDVINSFNQVGHGLHLGLILQ